MGTSNSTCVDTTHQVLSQFEIAAHKSGAQSREASVSALESGLDFEAAPAYQTLQSLSQFSMEPTDKVLMIEGLDRKLFCGTLGRPNRNSYLSSLSCATVDWGEQQSCHSGRSCSPTRRTCATDFGATESQCSPVGVATVLDYATSIAGYKTDQDFAATCTDLLNDGGSTFVTGVFDGHGSSDTGRHAARFAALRAFMHLQDILYELKEDILASQRAEVALERRRISPRPTLPPLQPFSLGESALPQAMDSKSSDATYTSRPDLHSQLDSARGPNRSSRDFPHTNPPSSSCTGLSSRFSIAGAPENNSLPSSFTAPGAFGSQPCPQHQPLGPDPEAVASLLGLLDGGGEHTPPFMGWPEPMESPRAGGIEATSRRSVNNNEVQRLALVETMSRLNLLSELALRETFHAVQLEMTATYPLFVQQGKLVRDLFDRTQHTHESTAAEHDDLDEVVACIRLDAAIQFAEASAERNLIRRLLRHVQSPSTDRLAPLRGPSRARTESMRASASVSPRPETRDRQGSMASTVLDTPTDVHAVFEFDTADSTPPLLFDPFSRRSRAAVVGDQTPAVSASASPTRRPLPSQLTSSPALGSVDFIPSDQAALAATEPEMEMIKAPDEPSRVIRKSQSDPTAVHAAGASALSTSERAQLLHTTTVDYSNSGAVHGMPGRHRASRHLSGAHSRSALLRLLTTPLSTAHELASIDQQTRRTDVDRSNMAPRRSCPQREGSPEGSPWTTSCDGRMQTDPGLFPTSTVSHSVALSDGSTHRSQLPQAGASEPASHAAAGESMRKSRFRRLLSRSKVLFKRGTTINRVLPLADVPSRSVSANPSTTPRDLQPSNAAHVRAVATRSPIAVLRGSRDTYVPSLYEFSGAKESLLRRLERVSRGIERMTKKSEQQLQSQIMEVLTSAVHSSAHVSSAAPQSKESAGSLAADLTQIPRPHSHSMDSGHHALHSRDLSTPCDLQRTSSASASVTSPSDEATPCMSRVEALQQTLPQLTTYLQSLRRYTSSVNLINWKRHRGAANTALLPNDGGSTATVVTVMGNQLHVGNVGDSTCVVGTVPDVDALFRPATAASAISSATRRSSRRPLEGVHAQAQQQAQQRRRAASNAARAIVADRCSTDHRCGTPAEDARMLQAGASQRSVYYCMPMCENRLMLSRTLGDSPYHRCGAMLAEPCVTSRVLKETDAFMILATDGVWDVMELEEAVNITFDYLMDHNYHRRDAGQLYPPATNSAAPACDSHSQQSNMTGGSGFVSQVSFQEPVRRHQGPRHYSCDVRQQFDAQLQHQLDNAVRMTSQDASTVDGYVPRDPSVMYGMCVREAAAAVSCNTGRPLSDGRDGSRAPAHRSPVPSSTAGPAAMKGQGGEPLYCAVPQSRGSAILQDCATHLKRVAYRRSQARVAQAGEGRVDDIAVSIITFPAFWEAVRSRERSGSVVSTD